MCLSNMTYPQNRILIFDTETTGLCPKDDGLSIIDYPFILQLSYVIFNITTKTTEKIQDFYIKIPPHIQITSEITKINGITQEICDSKGVPIEAALNEFYQDYINCNCIVAHNLEFDSKMMLIELKRNRESIISNYPQCINLFNAVHRSLNGIECFCTQLAGINICNIMVPSKNGKKPYKKFPKLSELYEKLFDETPGNLHNALADTLICLRCYMKITHNYDIGNDLLSAYGI